MSENEEGFDDLDGVVPDELVDDTYLCEITKADLVTSKKPTAFLWVDGEKVFNRWFILNWQILEPELFSGFEPLADVYRVASQKEMQAAEVKERGEISSARRKRNARLEQLGVPRSEFNNIAAHLDTLLGIKAYLTVSVRPKKEGPGFNIWINNVTLATAVDESSLLDVSNL